MMVVSRLPSSILQAPSISPLANPHSHWERGRCWCVCVGKNNEWSMSSFQRATYFVLNISNPSPSTMVFPPPLAPNSFQSPPSNPFNPPPPFSSALKSSSHGVCSDSLFIKEMNSICIIHFFCELFSPAGS